MRASSTLGRFWARYQEKVSCWDWRWASRASFTAVSSAPSASLASTSEYGVAVAMDDFGSGYSSLNMLKDLSIDTLKVDRAFLEEAADNEKRNIIFVSVVEMARKLNISLVVEGVETGENVSLMRECGCNIAQGYYFARPMEESKFAELFREGKLC